MFCGTIFLVGKLATKLSCLRQKVFVARFFWWKNRLQKVAEFVKVAKQ
jgi:hypothetical protein